jgi:protein phosphatase
VAIYRGVDANIAGARLSHVAERVPLAVSTLPDFERKRVADGIHAKSVTDARQIVERLRPTPTPTPAPKATPGPKATPTPKATP